MNKVIEIGRLTRDPEVRYTTGESATAVARFTLAVDRKFKKAGDTQEADFISCVAFGKTAEFVEKWFKQGTKIVTVGRLTTGSYTNKDGVKVYTTDVTVEEVEFAESKGHSEGAQQVSKPATSGANGDGFMNVLSDIDADELPFS